MIEDKLQDGLPESIGSIGKVGKMWVLTGNKQETAIEFDYSTKVLHPKMNITDVSHGPSMMRALVVMECMRLVKMGGIKKYENKALQEYMESSLGFMFR